LSHVFGYAVGLDLTRRDLQTASRQKQQPWEIGKSFDQSAPCSAITPAERTGHLAKGRICLTVNGKVRQDADLDLMIWKVPDIIAALSTQVGLAAGDLICTGTPAGVAAVVKGDTLVGNIAGLEELTIRVV
jgi:fumarylpyruvate hydrolase